MSGVVDPFQPEGNTGGSGNYLAVPTTFKIRAVDGLTSTKPDIEYDVKKDLGLTKMTGLGVEQAVTPVSGDLNILAKFKGNFYGAGLNMIFRPSFGNNRRNNVLEYNVTEEATQFLEDLGNVPNRGLGRQRDVHVKAVPYTQLINDLLNLKTGKADRPDPVAIHFESGMFLRTPPTDVRPKILRGTISRLASIPHGTTINCQGFEPDMKNPTPGKPVFPPVSVLPFPKNTPDDLETFVDFFPQLVIMKPFNLRIPPEIKSGDALNESLMLNPNLMLEELNESSTKKRIKEHITFKVHSDPNVSKIPGGGTANIAFLQGSTVHDQDLGPNADGVSVGCEYWVSTVEYDVLLPEGDFSGDNNKQDRIVECEARKEERAAGKLLISPRFKIRLDKKIPPQTIVKLEATQIQYSQNVTLNFDDIGWPHISVATLSPSTPIPVKSSQLVF